MSQATPVRGGLVDSALIVIGLTDTGGMQGAGVLQLERFVAFGAQGLLVTFLSGLLIDGGAAPDAVLPIVYHPNPLLSQPGWPNISTFCLSNSSRQVKDLFDRIYEKHRFPLCPKASRLPSFNLLSRYETKHVIMLRSRLVVGDWRFHRLCCSGASESGEKRTTGRWFGWPACPRAMGVVTHRSDAGGETHVSPPGPLLSSNAVAGLNVPVPHGLSGAFSRTPFCRER